MGAAPRVEQPMRQRPLSKVPKTFKEVTCPYPSASIYYGTHGAINYSLDGPPTGELVVCLHGLNASRTMFKAVGDALCKVGFQVLSFDMYGHGLSNAPSVSLCPCRCRRKRARYDLDFFVDQTADLLDGLGLSDRPANFVGFSMGGSVAIAYSKRFPARVVRLCLLSPAGCLPQVPKQWYLLKAFWCILIPLADHVLSPCCYKKEKFTKGAKGQDPKALEQLWNRTVWLLFVKHGTASASLAVMLRVPWFGLEKLFTDVGRHSRPVLLIWGEDDNLNPVKTAEEVHAKFLNSHLTVIKDAQHIVISDQPQLVFNALCDFLRMPVDTPMREVVTSERCHLSHGRLRVQASPLPPASIIGSAAEHVSQTIQAI